jgi:hypothetical protein
MSNVIELSKKYIFLNKLAVASIMSFGRLDRLALFLVPVPVLSQLSN